jgi:hypothetical protein
MEDLLHQALRVVDAHLGHADVPSAVRRHAAAVVAARLGARLHPPLAPELSWSLDLVAEVARRQRELGGAWESALVVPVAETSAPLGP